LARRLRERGEDAEEVIQRRLVTASREIEQYDKYEYILINDKLEESSESLQAVVQSERLRRAGKPLSAEEKKIVDAADRYRLANVRDRILRILTSFGVPTLPAGL